MRAVKSILVIVLIFISFVSSVRIVSPKNCGKKNNSIKPARSWLLSDTLQETSGLIYWENYLYTHNDDTDNAIYQLDLTGKITKRIPLAKTKNTDWEDMAQDDHYMYIGDFGNNGTGQRKDLKILRITKASLFSSPKIDTILFDYPDRILPSMKETNATDFDCEAMVVYKDSIYLFTKEWLSFGTTVYALPAIPGNYRAVKKVTYLVDGLITGADMTKNENRNILLLCGYSKLLQPFIYLCYDFEQTHFFEGCVKKIAIKLNFHQIEGISLTPEGNVYMTNEYFKKGIQTPAKLHYFNLKEINKNERIRK
jgi:hypothetical protein